VQPLSNPIPLSHVPSVFRLSIRYGTFGNLNIYDATLERIRSQDGEKAKLAVATLMWVCHSERPLQVDELCHALAVEIGSADFDPDNVPLIATLMGCCQGLITVDKEALTVRLIHHTLQEYLSASTDLFVRIFTKVPYLRQWYYTDGLDQDVLCLESVWKYES